MSASEGRRTAPAHGAGAALGGARRATTPMRGGPAPPERVAASRKRTSSVVYGVAMKFQVLDVAAVDVGAPAPYWLTFQIRFFVDGSGVAAA